MNGLFAPAMMLMTRLRYAQKFSLIFVLVLLPLLILSYELITSLDEQISFREGERVGLEYIAAVRSPIEHMQQHRGMTAAFLGGASEFESRIMQKRGDVDKFLQQLQEVDKRLGGELKTSGKLSDVSRQWQEIKSKSLGQSQGEAVKSHSKMISELLALQVHVADVSGITLDPDLDSYYLGNVVVSLFPQLIENMGQARAVGSGIAAKGSYDQSGYVRLSVLANNIDVLSGELSKSLQTAIDANDTISQKLGSTVNDNNQAIANILKLLQDDLLNAEKITVSGDTVFDAATQAISGSYKLYDELVPELDSIWMERIDDDRLAEYIEITVVVTVLLLLSYIFVGFYLSVKQVVSQVGEATGKLAAGDMRVRLKLDTKDEMQDIAQNFNKMAEQFTDALRQISSATGQLAAASEEVSAIARESSDNLNEQRAETEQVATAMNEMSSTVQEVASSAADAAGAAANADKDANAGMSVVGQTASSIEALAVEVESSAKVIDQVAKDSEEIGKVLDVIKGIAEQTNLLALNAAIEAARAGEQGRGFAVVADEVRTLAGRTHSSTQEIESMIEKLQTGANNAVEAMKQGQEKAAIGVDQAAQAGAALEAITSAVSVINQMNNQIASAAEEQSITTEEMNQRIVNINTLTEQTTESAVQSSVSSEELSRLASDLQGLVSRFKLD